MNGTAGGDETAGGRNTVSSWVAAFWTKCSSNSRDCWVMRHWKWNLSPEHNTKMSTSAYQCVLCVISKMVANLRSAAQLLPVLVPPPHLCTFCYLLVLVLDWDWHFSITLVSSNKPSSQSDTADLLVLLCALPGYVREKAKTWSKSYMYMSQMFTVIHLLHKTGTPTLLCLRLKSQLARLDWNPKSYQTVFSERHLTSPVGGSGGK